MYADFVYETKEYACIKVDTLIKMTRATEKFHAEPKEYWTGLITESQIGDVYGSDDESADHDDDGNKADMFRHSHGP